MDNHGIARVARTARTEEQRQQDLEKIKKYRELEDSIREKTSGGFGDPALFPLTSKLLRLNPEYYTIWNVRRCCLTSGLLSKPPAGSWPSKASPSISQSEATKPSSDASLPSPSDAIPPNPDPPTTGPNGTTADIEADTECLRSELTFTIPLLLEFPKCYWIWKHRKWLLEQAILRLPLSVACTIWKTELALASKMLIKDRRNFHAWGYRRSLVARLESPELLGKSLAEDEFAYTTKMITEDLSNFSAWHNRSRLMLRVLDERHADDRTRAAFLATELGIIQDALNVGPEDQSLWYYHRYLMSQIVATEGRPSITPDLTSEQKISYLEREIEFIKDLLQDFEAIKWPYEALIEYTLALLKLRPDPQCDDGQDSHPSYWLARLRKLDSMQTGRWDDVGREIEQQLVART